MTETRLLGRRSRRLAVLLLAVTGLPAATLVWLGLQLLQQERALQAQRAAERQQAALGHVIRSLEGSLADAERHVAAGRVPDGMTRLALSADGVVAEPADRMPLGAGAASALPDVESRRFADAERLEFQGQDLALASYQKAAQSPVAAVKAGALLRAARVLRRQGQWDSALAAYDRLARIDGLDDRRRAIGSAGAPGFRECARGRRQNRADAPAASRSRPTCSAGAGRSTGRRGNSPRPTWDDGWVARPCRGPTERSCRLWLNSFGSGDCRGPKRPGARSWSSATRR